MIRIFARDTMTFVEPDSLQHRQSGNPSAWAALEAIITDMKQDALLDIQRLVPYLNNVKNSYDLSALLSSCAFRLQGTDGIRGLVSSCFETPANAIKLFMKEHLITPVFISLYVQSFLSMLQDSSDIEICTVVFGEDGRDYYDGGLLKQAVMESVCSMGWNVLDLGIVPTPALVYESVVRDCPALMLTASHNPAEYNGLKLFVHGRKLYPQGTVGEYALTYRVCTQIPEQKKELGLVSLQPGKASVEAFLDKVCTPSIIAPYLAGRTVFLDAACGAYSHFAAGYLESRLGVHVVECASQQGAGKINKACGVGIVENLLEEGPIEVLSPECPQVLKELAAASGSVYSKEPLAIILDGDGDRGFLGMVTPDGRIDILNGDMLAFSILQHTLLQNPQGHFVCTVESDFALLAELSRICTWSVSTTCVGDRWLVVPQSGSAYAPGTYIGCERSGHVIIPLAEGPGVVLTGNGLATVLLALQAWTQGVRPTYSLGTFIRRTWRDVVLENFFRGSPQWDDIQSLIREKIPFGYKAVAEPNELDMMLMELEDRHNRLPVGRLFIRRSGTEPKISLTLSVLDSYQGPAQEFMKTVQDELSRIFSRLQK